MNKIFYRTLFGGMLLFTFSLVIYNIYIWNHTRSFLIEGIRKNLSDKIALAKALLGDNDFEKIDEKKLHQFTIEIKKLTSLRTTFIDKSGRVIADSEILPENLFEVENHINRPEVQEAMRIGSGLSERISATVNKKLFYYCETLHDEGRIKGFIRLAMFSPEFDERMDFLNGLIYRTVIFFIFATLFIIIAYIWWLNSQLEKVIRPISNQRDSSEFQEIPRHKYEELDRLVNEINTLGHKSEKFKKNLEAKKEQLYNIFNSLNEGVAAFRNNGKAIFSNTAFHQILGISSDHKDEFRFYDLIQFPPMIQDIEEFLSKGKPIKKRIKYYGQQYIEYQILPIVMNDTPLSGFLLTITDVTHLQQLETIRQDFVTNVSHEFKTPLTSIRGYAETLLSDKNDSNEERKKFLKKIENQTIRLENLVTDLLQLSRIEKKETDELIKIKPIPLLEKMLIEFENLIAKKDIKFSKDIPKTDKKVVIRGNEHLLRNIVSNLMSNSIQYNSSGGKIWFRLKVTKKNIRLEIEDTGAGIPKAHQARIFERFYRVDTARAIYPEGSGLGLSIVKHSVEMLSGKMGLESEINKGSLFWIEIPLVL